MIGLIKHNEEKLNNIRLTIRAVNQQMKRERVTDLVAYRQSKATLKELKAHEKSVEAELAWELKQLEKKVRASWGD